MKSVLISIRPKTMEVRKIGECKKSTYTSAVVVVLCGGNNDI